MSSGHPREPYQYTALNKIVIDSVMHVFGIVSYVGSCSTTRKGDQCLPITLVDETTEDRSWGLKCNIFARERCRLPPLDCIGKVLCFQKLFIGDYKGCRQGRGNCQHGSLTWVLFPRDTSKEKLSSSSCSYVETRPESERSKELYTWWDQVEAADREREAAESVDVPRKYARIEDLWPGGSYYDLRVQVLAVYIFPGEKSAMLRVWDGTPRKYTPCHAVPYLLDDAKGGKSHAPVPKDLTFDVFIFDNHVAKAKELKLLDFVELRNVIAKPLTESLKEFVEAGCSYKFTEPYKDYMQVLLRTGNSFGRGIFPCVTTSPQCIALKAQLKAAFDLQPCTNVISHEKSEMLMRIIKKLKGDADRGSTHSGTVAASSSGSREILNRDSATVNVDGVPSPASFEPTTSDLSGNFASTGALARNREENQTTEVKGATEPIGSEKRSKLGKTDKEYPTSYISELRPSVMSHHLLVQILECQVNGDVAKLTVWDGTESISPFKDLELEEASNMLGPSLPADYMDLSPAYKLPIYITGEIIEKLKSFRLLDIVVLRNVMVTRSNKRRADESIESGSVMNNYCMMADLKGSDKPEAFVMAPDSPAALTLNVRLSAVRQQATKRKEKKQ